MANSSLSRKKDVHSMDVDSGFDTLREAFEHRKPLRHPHLAPPRRTSKALWVMTYVSAGLAAVTVAAHLYRFAKNRHA